MRYSINNPDQIVSYAKGLVFGLFHDLRNDPGTIIVFNKCELGLKSAWRKVAGEICWSMSEDFMQINLDEFPESTILNAFVMESKKICL